MATQTWWEKWSEDPGIKRNRQEKALDLATKLQDLGIDDPATINKTVDNYVQTGMLVLPTTQESRVNMGDGSVRQKGRTTISDLGTTEVSTQPVRLGKKFGVYNEATGEGTMVPDLQGAATVHAVDTPKAQRNGMIVAYTGDKDRGIQVINAVPTDGPSKWVRVDNKPAAGGARGGTRDLIQDRVDMATIATYQRSAAAAAQRGQPVSQEIIDQAVQAAERLGMPTHSENVDVPAPGFWNKVSRVLPFGDTGMETVPTRVMGQDPNAQYQLVRQAPPSSPEEALAREDAARAGARANAIQMLLEHGYPVTEKNVAAIIQRASGGR
jgi:hypothetical protein